MSQHKKSPNDLVCHKWKCQDRFISSGQIILLRKLNKNFFSVSVGCWLIDTWKLPGWFLLSDLRSGIVVLTPLQSASGADQERRMRMSSRSEIQSPGSTPTCVYLHLLVLLPLLAVEATPAISPQSQRGIIFPKETFDDCLLDDVLRTKGTCRRMEECPSALKGWLERRESPKTCYFVRFDHFVCCEPDKELPEITTGVPPTLPTLPTLPTTRNPFIAPLVTRSSLQACYENNNVQQVNERDLTFVVSVVGGKPTRYREFPFMAALGWRSNFDQRIYYRCGGALISNNFVLTAAHCADLGGEPPSQVRLGGDNLTLSEGEDLSIRRVIVHPEYSASTAYNDIALLELETPAKPAFKPTCIWGEKEVANSLVTAIGYGQTSFAGLSSAQLLKVPLKSVSNEECQVHYQVDQLAQGVLGTQMCAGDITGERDTCQGDSGGPLLMQDGPLGYIVGITSLGQGCASGPPSVYTRVSSFIDWIEGIVWPQGFQPTQHTPISTTPNAMSRLDFDLRADT
ncbi:serine protease persephone isoform X1 [Drosophila elegans]|uniref:serine protease persephone isoform X1 n=2 Tax=Drosophila elegans TaxID=30023 RepID=UPI001BC85224|nr:serine protease persephone isoform X1 [Drosophila elegans]